MDVPGAAPAPAAIASQPTLNVKQATTKINKAKEDTIALRQQLWPEVTEDHLWLIGDRKKKGFSSIPRVMPLLMNLIQDASKQVSKKSIPAGRTYLVLWCRVFGEGMVNIDNETVAASEAGYVGERAVSTWREHMRVLKALGFIDLKLGQAGPMQFVLLYNPYKVAKALRGKKWITEDEYNKLYQRATQIGARPDLE